MKKKGTIIIVILLVILLAGIYASQKKLENDTVIDNDKIEVNTNLYFSDEFASSLVVEKVAYYVENDSEKYIGAINKLIGGPTDKNNYSSINKNTVVNSLKVKDNLCTVDFSSSLIEYNTGGLREVICLYSVVNTLCEFEEIKQVIFTIDGESIETFGQLDMTEPYTKNMCQL